MSAKAAAKRPTHTRESAIQSAAPAAKKGTKAVSRPRPKKSTSPGTAGPTTGPKIASLASTARRRQRRSAEPSGINLLLVFLSVLSLLAAATVAVLVVERVTTPPRMDPDLLLGAADAYSAMYSLDYTDPDGSVDATLAVLTGDLREQFQADLDAQVVPSYLEVSATTRGDNITVGAAEHQ